jgi:hypothetical protein
LSLTFIVLFYFQIVVVNRGLRRRKRSSISEEFALKRQNVDNVEEDQDGSDRALEVDGSEIDGMHEFHVNPEIEECD